jgi:hypothetical protein
LDYFIFFFLNPGVVASIAEEADGAVLEQESSPYVRKLREPLDFGKLRLSRYQLGQGSGTAHMLMDFDPEVFAKRMTI